MSDGYDGYVRDEGDYFGVPSFGSKAEAPPDRIDVYKLPPQETRDVLPSLLQGDSVGLMPADDAARIDPRHPGMLQFVREEDVNPEGPPITGGTAP